MEFTMIRGECPDGHTCPAVHRTAWGTLLVTGTSIAPAAVPAGQGDAVVEVPEDLIPEAADGHEPSVSPTGRGTLLVTGMRITDPAALAELPVGPGEAVVELASALIVEGVAHAG